MKLTKGLLDALRHSPETWYTTPREMDLLDTIDALQAEIAELRAGAAAVMTPKITRREWGIRETEPRTYSEAELVVEKRKAHAAGALEEATHWDEQGHDGEWTEKRLAQLRAEAGE